MPTSKPSLFFIVALLLWLPLPSSAQHTGLPDPGDLISHGLLSLVRMSAPIAAVAAAYLIWRKGRFGWLFAYVALFALLRLTLQLLQSTPGMHGLAVTSGVFSGMSVLYVTLDWLFLVVAAVVKRGTTPSTPRSAA